MLEATGEVTPELMRFAVSVQEAPSKIRGTEWTHTDAVRDIVLMLWRRKLKRERGELERTLSDAPSRELRARCNQITLDLDSLKKWDDGKAIIELEIED